MEMSLALPELLTIRQLEVSLTTKGLESMILKLVLTVPAIWDQNAVSNMRLAAKRAGLLDARPIGETTIRFISEPAAAALAAYEDLEIRNNKILEVCILTNMRAIIDLVLIRLVIRSLFATPEEAPW